MVTVFRPPAATGAFDATRAGVEDVFAGSFNTMPPRIMSGSERPFKRQISSMERVLPHSFCAMSERESPERTVYSREVGAGAAAGFGRIASIVAPLSVPALLVLWGNAGLFALFGGTFLVGAVAAYLLLPERAGESLDAT